MRRPVDRWLVLVATAFALRAATVAVLALTQVVPHNGWYWANKDQVEYYGFAHALLHGAITAPYTFIGYGALLAPLVGGTEFALQALPVVVVVHLLLAVPAAVLLYRAGTRLADRRAAAVATALWLTTPLWLSTIWLHSYSPPFNVAIYWLGLTISPDYASALLAIGVLYVAAEAERDASALRGATVGVLAGLAFLVKPSNIVIVGAVLLANAVWRRWRAALAAGIASGLVVSAQIVLNGRINGNPLKFSYSSAWPFGRAKSLASVAYVPRTFGKLFLLNYTGPLLGLAAVAALAVTWRRFPAMRWLVAGQVVAFALFFSPLYYSISEFMLRFMTPALPALCLAAGAAIAGRARPEGEAAPAARSPGRVTATATGAALAAAVALAIVVGLAPLAPLLPVVHSMAPVAARIGPGRVALSWRAPDAPATLAYQVVRSRRPATVLGDRTIWGGRSTRLTDRPGAGTWWYRVYVTPGARPGGLPPSRAFAESVAVRVVLSP